MNITLRRRLPEGPLTIIGDVHGELVALRRLLSRLGVDAENGRSPRHLVFVGDLVDRGPDSPGVVRLVRQLCEAGVASCVLGNHEFNLLCGARKEGNQWLSSVEPEGFVLELSDQKRLSGTFDSVTATTDERASILQFFATLPLTLERDDLRVVHACWSEESLAKLPAVGDVVELSRRWDQEVDALLERRGLLARREEELRGAGRLRDPHRAAHSYPHAHVEVSELRQRANPIRALTSGLEQPIEPDAKPSFKAGKWRYLRRSPWWRSYEEAPAVVVGHYWRQRAAESEVWDASGPMHWTGPRGNVFCVDFSAGRRYAERLQGHDVFRGGLAALQWPERTLWFDDRPEPEFTQGWDSDHHCA